MNNLKYMSSFSLNKDTKFLLISPQIKNRMYSQKDLYQYLFFLTFSGHWSLCKYSGDAFAFTIDQNLFKCV